MYLNPFRDFVNRILYGAGRMRRRPIARKRNLPSHGGRSFTLSAEVCEARMMLSGPQLIQVSPNTGGALTLTSNPASATVQNTAPTQLTFTFSAGVAINPATLNAITVTRAGGDGVFGNANDVQVATPFLQVDPSHQNQVVMRFANSLPDDLYQIKITGALKDAANNSFNSGVTQLVDFKVDFGSQVVSVVPQPVVRSALLNVGGLNALVSVGNQSNGSSQIQDGQTFSITDGGTSVTFQFQDAAKGAGMLPLGAGNVSILFNGSTAVTPDSATVIAGKMVTAINGSALGGLVTATANGNVVLLAGQSFSPFAAKIFTPNAASLTVVNNFSQITNGDTFTVSAGGKSVTFQFQDIAGPILPLGTNVGILYNGASSPSPDSASVIAADIVTAINAQAGLNVTAAKTGGNASSTVALTGAAFSPVVTLAVANPGDLSVGGVSAALMNILDPTQITDHSTFAIAAAGTAVVFEFTSTGSVNTPGATAIHFGAGDSADALVFEIATAINNSPLAGLVMATSNGTGVTLAGVGAPGQQFSPAVTLDPSISASFMTVGTSALSQASNIIVVYFNQNPLDPAAAQNPAFYQVSNITDGSILEPTSVKYNAAANNAVLTFANPLPAGTFHLQIGAPAPVTNTIAGAVNVGTLYANPDGVTPSFLTTGYLGTSSAVNMYSFQQGASGGTVSIAASNLDPSFSSGVQLQEWDITTGVPVLVSAGVNNDSFGAIANHTYAVGVSAFGNSGYDPTTGANASPGTGFGTYRLTINDAAALTQASDTTSFATSTNLGTLGSAGFTISSAIAPLGNLSYPQLPGGLDTPGNRNLNTQGISGESNDAGSGISSSPPGTIPTFTYDFRDIYGTVLGVQVHNAITENQKNDARQIFDMYGRYLGVKFVEVASGGGLGVVTGDIRAVAPALDPNAAGGISGGGLVIMNANVAYGSSPYGGAWFGVAFHEIGHSLGLSHSYDAPGTMGAGSDTPGGGATIEPVFPGDIALVPAERIKPPDSTDINLYQFQVTQAGTFSAETIAQRLTLPAFATSDFNTTGNVIVKFTAVNPGQAGNGIKLLFSIANLGASTAPTISVDGTQIAVVLNTNLFADGSSPTTAQDLVNALNADPLASKLIVASISGGAAPTPGSVDVANAGIAPTVTLVTPANPSLLDSVITLYSAASQQASITTSLNTASVSVTITAKPQGAAGNGISIAVTKADLGLNTLPIVSVVGSQISVILNTHGGTGTSVQQFVDALNNDLLASNLVSAAVNMGGAIKFVSSPINYSPLVLQGGAGARTIIARNDDYFGKDSFVSLHLNPGTYFVAISSRGNTNFDPSIADSGFGGNTDGAYQLKIKFTADPAVTTTLKDAGGVPLDGDGGNTPGGTFNFWFQAAQAANAVFVDKANASDLNQDGTLAHPYGDIASGLAAAAAITAAAPGTITTVRIEGNGGTDGNPGTPGDNLPYLIGFDHTGLVPEQDGSTFVVPQGVDVMIDAGAILKLHSAIIDAGNSVPGIDLSGGALQVLGTPASKVIFTSLFNNAVGGNSDVNNFAPPSPGDWGGIVFRQASDFQGKDFLGNGVFLDSVNEAVFTFGGGEVLDNSVLTVFDPITIQNPDASAQFFARPAIWFDNISKSADAAMSADPNSFANTEDRIGPDVYGNSIVDNTINGFFIRIRTNAGQPIDTLGLAARIVHTDVVYVLTSTLLIDGNPGGPLENSDPNHVGWDARVGGSLVIDPGVIMKLSGAAILAQVGGSQLIAEGTAANPVIFTSLADDAYGTGGTYDTDNDNATANPGVPAAGNWGGIFFNSDSHGSIDHAVIQYAGGTVPIPGGFDQFNAVEIQQADVRIANSLFFSNAGGQANQNVGDGTGNRDGLLTNSNATIFVRGAQPVIVNNQFLNNQGFVLSVNANALNNLLVSDWGRSTGALGAVTVDYQNYGPLINGNTYTGNPNAAVKQINGMEVRAEEITTQTIWDDADIVHVVTGTIDDSINQHTFGGIKLASNADASLVVKFAAGAGFTINGIPLDISDRIGGTLQVVGSAAHPVILTSLKDDSVGAGFRLDGQPQLDTNGDGSATTPQSGDWSGINLGQYSNDRNVAVVLESEGTASVTDQNGTPATAQFMGNLAPDLPSDNANAPQGGSDYQPLGFAVFGTINKPNDVDVYSFNAAAGTEVWFDLGLTSSSLASVLELVDAQGHVLASSDPQRAINGGSNLTGLALPMMKDPNLGPDFYTSNPRDAGMRVVLPGAAGTTQTYFIRVRSDQGQTQGSYELQVRLRQQWETPGSTIQYSNISWAQNGITLQGLPNNSPLVGNAVSNGTNTTFGAAQDLGNLLQSNTNTLSAAGTLNTDTQVDWYKFNLNVDLIQVIAGGSDAAKTWSTLFDIDYADGLSRPDTTMSIFDSTGKLIYVSRDSNATSDAPGPLQGNGLTDLSRGSAGGLDPFIGPAQLPAGSGPGSPGTFTYYVAISSNKTLPQALSATFEGFLPNGGPGPTGADRLVRLEPVTSVHRVVEDHIGFTGYDTGNPTSGNVHVTPTSGALLPIDSAFSLSANVVPMTLSDVVLYGVSGSNLVAIDPFTGANEYTVASPFGGLSSANIKMRSDGVLYAVEGLPGAANTAGRLVILDPGTGAAAGTVGNDGIPDFNATTNPPDLNQLTTDVIDSFVWVGNPGGYSLYYAVHDNGTGNQTYNGGVGASRLYNINPTTGATQGFRGEIANPTINPMPPPPVNGDTTIGFTTGMEWLPSNNTVYGVTSTGQFVTINLGNGKPSLVKAFAGVSFTGLTLGPQNLQGGIYKDTFFATTSSGQLMAFDKNGNAVAAFVGGASSINVSSSATGLAFSPLDFNLWHPTSLQGTAAGHGINATIDNSRNTTWIPAGGLGSNTDSRPLNESQGGISYYFGLENWTGNPSGGLDYITYNNVDSQYGVLSSRFQQNLTSNSSQSGINSGLQGSYNLPGGAHGSLQTNSFSLATYSAGDAPTLYFNYLLQTDNGSGDSTAATMTDSARVFVSTDGGLSWHEAATNNPALSTNVPTTAELATYITPNASANQTDPTSRSAVQPLMGSNSWRQARVDLSPYAGNASVRLRFDFSTAGAAILQQNNFNSGVGSALSKQNQPGDFTGVGPNSGATAQNNNHVGFFIDDIIVGFANRGELVTAAPTGETMFVSLPQNPKPGAPTQSLIGPYQLEIRSATPYASTITGTSPDTKITSQFDDNTRFTSGFTLNAQSGGSIANGQNFTISDGVNTVEFVFDPSGTPLLSNQQLVAFTSGDSAPTVARSIRDAINAAAQAGKFKVTAELSDGLITGSSSPFGVVDTDADVDLINAVSVTGSISRSFYNRVGDRNTVRNQGRIEILNNSISNSAQYGIVVQPNPNPGTDPGAVRNLPTLDSNRQVPAIDIVSNVIFSFGTGGILFQGSNSNSATVPFGRIVNNTINGANGTAAGTGINVQNNAAPTILNNIISNTATAISIDNSSSAGTVVGTEVFKGDTNNGTPGTNFIQLAPSDPLYVNPGSKDESGSGFYLAEFSKAIDSSLNSLQDRAPLAAVLASVGLPQQPIIAPPNDRFGQLRVDDPNVPNASGLGNNIFIDRGAIEHADFAAPTAQLTVPLDNGPGDGNSTVGTVFITTPTPLTQFAVTLNDVGIGIDNNTAGNPAAYVVTEQDTPNGPIRTLVNGVDYQFVYNPNTHIAQFNSVSVFPSASNYTITLATTGPNTIMDLAGNTIQPNQADGTLVFTINGNAAPTLTSIDPFPGIKSQPVTLTYAQLVANSTGLSVVAGHTTDFLITSIGASTVSLTVTHNSVPAAAVAGTTLIQPGDSLTWTPISTAVGNTTAFSVVAYDPQNALIAPLLKQSSPPVDVVVNEVDVAPKLTAVSTLGLDGKNSPFSISFATLLAASDAQTVGNHPVRFKIASFDTGTLQLQTGNTTTTLTINNLLGGPNEVTFGPGQFLIWTPNNNDTGNKPAFHVVAFDPVNAVSFPGNTALDDSSPPVQVSVLISTSATVAPVLAFAPPSLPLQLQEPRFVSSTITFSQLAAGSSWPPGDIQKLRIDSIVSGSLLKNGATPVVAGTTMIQAGDTLTWVPNPLGPTGPTGVTPAFFVAAFDGTTNLASLDGEVDLDLVNKAPVIANTSATIGPADQQSPFVIGYATLLGATGATDPNNDAIGFKINSFANGAMTITHNNVTTNVVPGTTLVRPSDVLTWTPGNGITGVVSALNITAFDLDQAQNPMLASANSTAISVNVRAFGSAFDLSGVWTSAAGGLDRINQTGSNLTYIDQSGNGSSGVYTSGTTITGFGMTGTIDTSTADQGRILWSNGTIWLRISLGGQWAVSGNVPTALGSISQTGVSLSFNGPSGSSSGSIAGPTQVMGYGMSGTLLNGTTIVFPNGQIWTKLDLSPNYTTSAGGGATQVVQNGTTTLGFVNSQGQSFSGNFTDPSHLITTSPATGFPVGTTATIGGGKITWSTGEVWSENLSIQGTNPGGTPVSITVTPTLITLVNAAGQLSFANITAPNTITVISGAMLGLTGTRVNGGISWSNGGTWSNFDFNALNAAFAANITSQNAPTVIYGQNPGGMSVGILYTANQISLINSANQISHAQLTTQTTFLAIDGPMSGLTGTLVSAGRLNLSNGGFWLNFDPVALNTFFDGPLTPGAVPAVLNGNNPGGVTVTITFNGSVLSLINSQGQVSHAVITNATTITAIDGVMNGLTLTLASGGKLNLSNGGVWNNFDPVALNALFTNVPHFPFPP
jgi:hypothetical protein